MVSGVEMASGRNKLLLPELKVVENSGPMHNNDNEEEKTKNHQEG